MQELRSTLLSIHRPFSHSSFNFIYFVHPNLFDRKETVVYNIYIIVVCVCVRVRVMNSKSLNKSLTGDLMTGISPLCNFGGPLSFVCLVLLHS